MTVLTHGQLRKIRRENLHLGLCLFPQGHYSWTCSEKISHVGYICAAWHLQYPHSSVSINFVDLLSDPGKNFSPQKVRDSFKEDEIVSWELLARMVQAITLEASCDKGMLYSTREVFSA